MAPIGKISPFRATVKKQVIQILELDHYIINTGTISSSSSPSLWGLWWRICSGISSKPLWNSRKKRHFSNSPLFIWTHACLQAVHISQMMRVCTQQWVVWFRLQKSRKSRAQLHTHHTQRVGAIFPFVFNKEREFILRWRGSPRKQRRKKENRKPLCPLHAIKWLSGSDAIYSARNKLGN